MVHKNLSFHILICFVILFYFEFCFPGRLLIQDDWRGAVHMILRPGPNMGTSIKIQKVEFLKHRYQETKSAKLTLRGTKYFKFFNK